MRVLFIRAVPAMFIVTLLAAPGAAQERCKWSSDGRGSDTQRRTHNSSISTSETRPAISSAYMSFLA